MAGRNLREDVREVAAFDRCKLELEPGQEHGKPLFQLPSHKHLDFLVLDLGLIGGLQVGQVQRNLLSLPLMSCRLGVDQGLNGRIIRDCEHEGEA